jgi:hypothetical protein
MMAELCLPVRVGVSNVWSTDLLIPGFSDSFPFAMTGVTHAGRNSFYTKITDRTKKPGIIFSGVIRVCFQKKFSGKDAGKAMKSILKKRKKLSPIHDERGMEPKEMQIICKRAKKKIMNDFFCFASIKYFVHSLPNVKLNRHINNSQFGKQQYNSISVV